MESPVLNVEESTVKGAILFYTVNGYSHYVSLKLGCWLGNPKTAERLWVAGHSPRKVAQTELTSSYAAAVGRKLLAAFFTPDKIAKGNCTPSRHNLLDQEVIQGIRSTFCYMYITCIYMYIHVYYMYIHVLYFMIKLTIL